ncbi:MAG TPA: MipA/OmpV family protein [Burkholderiales bacterium]|nr:MipA/OmpV family protein [Burkholderiales bacterium]
MPRACLALLVSCVLATHVLPSRAREQPLWEAGIGAAAIAFPDYRGSDQRHNYLLPFPYIVYRGDVLKADRERVRGLFFSSDRIDLNLSANAAVPVKSAHNEARLGMPDLDPTVELGPSLEVKLARAYDGDLRLEMRLPVRTVVATDLAHSKNVGWVFEPQLNLDLRNTALGPDWNLGMAAGPLFGDKRYHNYYYGVAPAFATPTRPAYTAQPGYAGMQVIGAMSRNFGAYWVGAFLRWDTVAGAVFDDSPLIRQQHDLAFGFGITWTLSRAARMVQSED